jgi:hypothetical protein
MNLWENQLVLMFFSIGHSHHGLKGFSKEKMMKEHIRSLVGSLLLLILLLTACSGGKQTLRTPSIIEPTKSLANLPTSTPPENTSTRKADAPTFSPTEMLTSLPTWTPLVTLTTNQATKKLNEWMQYDPSCQFPCWAGIVPGVTTWEEAKSILTPVVNILAVYEGDPCVGNLCNLIEWESRNEGIIRGEIVSQPDGTIIWNHVSSSRVESVFKLNEILTLYGKPEKAYISTSTFLMPPDQLSLVLILAYPNHHFIFTAGWDAGLQGNNIVTCLHSFEGGGIDMKLIDGEWSDSVIRKVAFTGRDVSSVPMEPLEVVTDMTINQFYEKFMNEDVNNCIFTPAKYWP